MNTTNPDEDKLYSDDIGLDLFEKWHRLKYEGDVKNYWLMRLDTFDDDYSVTLFFEGYIHPPIAIVYLILIIWMAFIFYKNGLMSFVHHIIVVNTLVFVIPSVLTVPFFVTFYHFANRDAPLPYPWCFSYIILNEYIPKITFMVSLALKVVLAINRLCSVYFPFKMKYWFSKSRKQIYTITVILSVLVIEIPLNVIHMPVRRASCLDDLWNNGNMRVYTACSVLGYTIDSKNTRNTYVNTSIYEFVFVVVGVILFTSINIAFMVKLRRLASQRNQNLYGHNKSNNSRLNLLNKAYLWLVIATIVIEIPQYIMVTFTASVFLKFLTESENKFANKEETLTQCYLVIICKVLLPLDVFIFAFIGKKVRNAIKKSLCQRKCF